MLFRIYLLVLLIMNIITFFLYLSDKRKAIKNKWRTKESVLLSASFLCGAVGGLLGLYWLRHKNKHWYFVVVNWLSLIIQIALGGFIYLYL